MADLPLDVLPPAFGEVTEATQWYAERSTVAKNEFLEVFEAARRFIVDFPNAGTPHLFNTRSRLLTPFPYHVIYVVRDDRPLIVAVAHTSRRKGYWRDRIS